MSAKPRRIAGQKQIDFANSPFNRYVLAGCGELRTNGASFWISSITGDSIRLDLSNFKGIGLEITLITRIVLYLTSKMGSKPFIFNVCRTFCMG